ncbi:hypothetical protein ACT3CD_14800 [Geofilum sp. OHC36d9]|uniref:hypothetical protein n=1 Tax=Geofilum sp. OHC36d9 TaxID=3458413 RepID=UPI004034A9DB
MRLNLIKTLQGWEKTLLIIALIPILLLGFSLMTYGAVFNPLFEESGSSFDFFKLPNLFSLFYSDVALPLVVKVIGKMCTILLSIIAVVWVILYTICCYLQLSQQIGNKIELITELVIFSLIYFFFISPSSIVLFLLGLLLILINLGLILLYWIYELKSN